jgi:hypothetical protein
VRFVPVSPERLVGDLAEVIRSRHSGEHALRLALDGPRCAHLSELAEQLADTLRQAGRPVGQIDGAAFYRDASLRFEHGKTDVESFYSGWLDTGAIQREVLAPLGAGGAGRYLPALRDPATNRSSRVDPILLPPKGVLVVTGEMLLGVGLSFDVTVHASVSRQARRRLTEPDWGWTLPAFDRYDLEVAPVDHADVVLRYDDPRHPARFIR